MRSHQKHQAKHHSRRRRPKAHNTWPENDEPSGHRDRTDTASVVIVKKDHKESVKGQRSGEGQKELIKVQKRCRRTQDWTKQERRRVYKGQYARKSSVNLVDTLRPGPTSDGHLDELLQRLKINDSKDEDEYIYGGNGGGNWKVYHKST